ncbi:N-acetyltransferase [Microlunatus elymi]|uniref:N-acetyltransferase n=1 Tax=Microlunatus elymi TaxID=2596828 RepID=A0A516Q3Z5_9ACTN|nr:GNAT family N-acetyltransferase [Microlunatus elymi]QDP98160.1 N-acetyltransferase [Microlunatus elymi]
MTINVNDVPEQKRFEARDEQDQLLGFVDYRQADDTITFIHTEVQPAAEGNGVGSTLARAVLDQARADGFTVVPQCSFIRGWIDRHPDYADLVSEL